MNNENHNTSQGAYQTLRMGTRKFNARPNFKNSTDNLTVLQQTDIQASKQIVNPTPKYASQEIKAKKVPSHLPGNITNKESTTLSVKKPSLSRGQQPSAKDGTFKPARSSEHQPKVSSPSRNFSAKPVSPNPPVVSKNAAMTSRVASRSASNVHRYDSKSKLRVIPVGGLGEIGKNMTIIEYNDDILIIDCGLMFPTEEMMGIDLVIPDVSYLVERQEKIRGVVITHGHEDHIGALAYVLPQLGYPPVYASRLAKGLIGTKVREGNRGNQRGLVINTINPGESFQAGVFHVETIPVCHSIPDSCGLIIDTPVGKIVHTGDFKIDYTPVDGKPSDLGRLAKLGEDGVLLLMSDSTHVELSGYTASERMIGVTIDRIMNVAAGRVLVTTFASLISRIQQVIKASEKYQRKVFFVGRGMIENVKIAIDLGYLKVKSDTIVQIEELKKYKPEQVTLITTGSQGEPTSALVKIANKDHRQLNIIPGDTVVLSSSPIPGNDSLVNRTIDSLFKQGANVVYNKLEKVHVHGHASQEELKMILTVVKPKFFMPVHGEFRHLKLHSELACSLGMPKENVFAMEDGDILELSHTTAKLNGKIAVGNVYVDGLSVGDIGSAVIRSRQQLSQDGIVVAMITIAPNGTLVRRPDIVSLGFVDINNGGQEIIEESKELIVRTVHGARIQDHSALPSKVRDTLSNFYYAQTKRHPLVMPMIINV